MGAEFRQYMYEELRTMVREIGDECHGDLECQNARAIAWIEANAARFRAEWLRCHETGVADEWESACSGAN